MTQNKASQRSILITGCSTGIGRYCAQQLALRGYRVFATARDPDSLDALNAIDGIEALPLELTDAESVDALADEVLKRSGGQIYALFNNAGYGQPGAVEDLSREVLREQFETLVFGWFQLSNRLLPAMRHNGCGRIVQNSSVLGLIALPFRGAYNGAKFAIEGLSDTLRLELHGSGIHISLIEPGPISSRFRANAMAAFQKNIHIEASPFAPQYHGMLARLKVKGPAAPGTLPPESVYKALIHALESPHPKPRYRVTWPTHLFAWLRRLLSSRQLDRVLRKVSADELKRHQ